MTGLTAVIRKELKNLTGSGPGMFIMFALISLLWSFMLAVSGDAGGIWFVFFAVIVTANFSGTVFIAERVNGTLEVVITSGLSRDAVLFGKTAFIIAMTSIIGLFCGALAAVWAAVLPEIVDTETLPALNRTFAVNAAALYLSATLLNAAMSAYLSVRMGNPRFLHFVNLFLTGALVAAYAAAAALFTVHPYALALTFLLTGVIFTLLARREFAGERIIRPVIF